MYFVKLFLNWKYVKIKLYNLQPFAFCLKYFQYILTILNIYIAVKLFSIVWKKKNINFEILLIF